MRLAVNQLITNHNIEQNTLKRSATFANRVNKKFDLVVQQMHKNEETTLDLIQLEHYNSESDAASLANVTLHTFEVIRAITMLLDHFKKICRQLKLWQPASYPLF